MSKLREASEKYLQLRRKLGSQLRGVGSVLQDFVAFAEREGASYITTDLALRWAQQPAQAQPATWASRLRMVRRFAVWLSAIGSDARKCRPRACCPTVIAASGLTSTATRRSRVSSGRQARLPSAAG